MTARVSVSIMSQTRPSEPHLARDARVRFPVEQEFHDVPILVPCCQINCRPTALHTTEVGTESGLGSGQGSESGLGSGLGLGFSDAAKTIAVQPYCIRRRWALSQG